MERINNSNSQLYTQIEGYYTGYREPRNKHVLWIDNSTKDIKLKVFSSGKWKILCSTEDAGLSTKQTNEVESIITKCLTSFSTSITKQLGALLRDIQLEEKRASSKEKELEELISSLKTWLEEIKQNS